MAEIRNNFIKSKMNKDLDARLVPPGEYRNAQNVAISKSEGENVGAVENVLGNISLTDFGYSATCNVSIIGTFMDVVNDRIIVFMTNYVDTSGDILSDFATANAICSIGVYNVVTQQATLVVAGRFLNFSKTHPVIGVNLLEDLLFWTDNRNQPRKINIETALANTSYYTSEDNISVAKIYPYQPILLYRKEITGVTITSGGSSGTYVVEDGCLTTGGSGVGLTLDVATVNGLGRITGVVINNPGIGYVNGDTVGIAQRDAGSDGSGASFTLIVEAVSTMQDVTSSLLPDGTTHNPLYNSSWPGDPDYLKERFLRFSYRFKFDDDEYSLIAPFTQACFVPEQDGYFIGNDESISYKSTEVDFMVNKVNNIILQIPTPSGNPWDDVASDLNITEIDIICKESDQTTLKVIDTIPASVFGAVAVPTYYEHEYQSNKPWKTLPGKELVRVYDQVPVRALAQEVVGNRIIYGNYVDKPTPPNTLNYTTIVSNKYAEASGSYVRKEYQNHTLKQDRSYQVGVILCDRYGRQSTVLLSEIDANSASTTQKGSTIFHPFKASPFSTYPHTLTTDLLTSSDTWPGDSLKVQFIDTITSNRSSSTGEPGLYDATTNPLGWYSYKIVVKQTEQEYYNIYFPGILNGYVDGESQSPTAASAAEPICHFVLYSDNVNKVPRDLSLVGPNQTVFRTGRPSFKEDPSYYEFVGEDGLGFMVDPYSEGGERLLKERDRLRDLDSGSQVTNASIKLSLRVNNDGTTATQQWYPGVNKDVVTTIGTGSELGLWDPSAKQPFNVAPVFYGYENNPYVAKIKVSDSSIGQTGPSPDAGKLNFQVHAITAGGGNYVTGSKNIPVTIPTGTGRGENMLINIDNTSVGSVTSMSIADEGTGWDISSFATGDNTISSCTITGAGDADCAFTLNVKKASYAGDMSPVFTVYETEPVESKLDIYWETSTGDLVSTLNTAILAGETYDANTPVTLQATAGGDIASTHPETANIGDAVTGDFIPFSSTGADLSAQSVSATINSITDRGGTDWSTAFSITNGSSSGSFKITAAQELYYGTASNFIHDWDIIVNITVKSSTYLADGSTITVALPLTGGRFALTNVSPSITDPTGGAATGTGKTDGSQRIYPFVGENGSVSSTLKVYELSWNVEPYPSTYGPGSTAAPYFYMQSLSPGTEDLKNINGTPAGIYNVIVKLTDGGNFVTYQSITVTIT